MSNQKIIKLHGILADGNKAKTHQAADVIAFEAKGVIVKVYDKGSPEDHYVVVTTAKGDYTLPKSKAIINMYCGTARGIKVHFTAKKIVAKLIYWG